MKPYYTGETIKLPKSEVRGLVMQADVLGHESIMLHVDCTPDMTGEMLGVALTCRGELYGFQTIETASRPVELPLPYILNQNW